MITIFSPHISNRLTYVLDFCFKQKGIDYKLFTNETEFCAQEQCDLNYSNQNLEAKYSILPEGLLFESEIYTDKTIRLERESLSMDGVHDELSFIFFFLSRYEEYGPKAKDKHGRIGGNEFVNVQLGMNKKVVVDRIVMMLWSNLDLDYEPVRSQFKIIPSFDIDVAWAYKNRKFIRSVGAFFKGKKPIERLSVLSGVKKDPYDTYAYMREIASKTDEFLAFVLLGDWGTYDKNIHWENLNYGSLIRGLNLEGEVGIHPSYGSHKSPEFVENEISRLQKITGHEITLSRQHFLKFEFPTTFTILAGLGIKDDYSMGFADQIGFRAGTCFPFYFFDLNNNRQTSLLLHPFAYMDSALKDYLKESPEKAKIEVKNLMDEVKFVGGHFIMIWHNSSIHDKDEWAGWKAVLDYTIEEGLKV